MSNIRQRSFISFDKNNKSYDILTEVGKNRRNKNEK